MATDSRGIIFPGQGSQRRGMALDFAERYPAALRIFDAASEALDLDVARICRDETDPRLDLTEFTQPCILTAEIAMFEALKAHFGLSAEWFGGHSLGEYTALVAAGALRFTDAVRIVRKRGALMQSAAVPGFGGMAAVILEALNYDEVAAIAGLYGADVANDNSASQVVLSGELSSVERASAALLAHFGEACVRIVPLSVSAPFHSKHMASIEGEFHDVLASTLHSWRAEAAERVTSNTTGGFHTGHASDLLEALTRQISGRVRWRDNMEALRSRSSRLLEVGPNRPLSGFFKTIGVAVPAVIDLRTALRVLPTPAGLSVVEAVAAVS